MNSIEIVNTVKKTPNLRSACGQADRDPCWKRMLTTAIIQNKRVILFLGQTTLYSQMTISTRFQGKVAKKNKIKEAKKSSINSHG